MKEKNELKILLDNNIREYDEVIINKIEII